MTLIVPPQLKHGVTDDANLKLVLGSERLTGAALDRLTHRCHILETTGESYRLQDAKRRRRRTSPYSKHFRDNRIFD